jgi:hypothetical protein
VHSLTGSRNKAFTEYGRAKEELSPSGSAEITLKHDLDNRLPSTEENPTIARNLWCCLFYGATVEPFIHDLHPDGDNRFLLVRKG